MVSKKQWQDLTLQDKNASHAEKWIAYVYHTEECEKKSNAVKGY